MCIRVDLCAAKQALRGEFPSIPLVLGSKEQALRIGGNPELVISPHSMTAGDHSSLVQGHERVYILKRMRRCPASWLSCSFITHFLIFEFLSQSIDCCYCWARAGDGACTCGGVTAARYPICLMRSISMRAPRVDVSCALQLPENNDYPDASHFQKICIAPLWTWFCECVRCFKVGRSFWGEEGCIVCMLEGKEETPRDHTLVCIIVYILIKTKQADRSNVVFLYIYIYIIVLPRNRPVATTILYGYITSESL